MMRLTAEEVLLLHQRLVQASGGGSGLRDRGLLESAVMSAEAEFDGHPLYPELCQKAARLCFALTGNHPFADGNKRIGILAMLVMLRLNGIRLQYPQDELIRLGLAVAKGEWKYEEILQWILQHQ